MTSVVFREWYYEAYGDGRFLQVWPRRILGPEPSYSHALRVDPATGEIHGEAMLMGRLPRSRFRDLATGEQVVLPFGTAIALESFESELAAAFGLRKGQVGQGVLHTPDRHTHCWVQVRDTEGNSVKCDYHGNLAPLLKSGGKSAALPAALPGDGGPGSRAKSGASLDAGEGAGGRPLHPCNDCDLSEKCRDGCRRGWIAAPGAVRLDILLHK